MSDLTYQNVVHKRLGGKLFVIPTGCTGVVEDGGVFNIESGGKLVFDNGSTMTINNSVVFASGSSVNFASGSNLVLNAGSSMLIEGTATFDSTSGRLVLAAGSSVQIVDGLSSGTFTMKNGGVVNLSSGAALQIAGTPYIDTAGRIVQQFENKTSANSGDVLTNYGVTYVAKVALASTFILTAGIANVEKKIVFGANSTVAATVISSGCTIVGADTSTSLATITGSSFGGSVVLIAENAATWHLLSKVSTGIILS